MALSKSIAVETYGKELEFIGAYHQIVMVKGNKEMMDVTVHAYDDAEKKNFIKQSVYSFVPSVENNAKNFIAQGYIYLKTLNEFANATDVLEPGQTI